MHPTSSNDPNNPFEEWIMAWCQKHLVTISSIGWFWRTSPSYSRGFQLEDWLYIFLVQICTTVTTTILASWELAKCPSRQLLRFPAPALAPRRPEALASRCWSSDPCRRVLVDYHLRPAPMLIFTDTKKLLAYGDMLVHSVCEMLWTHFPGPTRWRIPHRPSLSRLSATSLSTPPVMRRTM